MPLPADMKGGPAQLTFYIGQDDCLYIHELQTDCLFKIYGDIADLQPTTPTVAAIAAAGPTEVDPANPPYLVSTGPVAPSNLDHAALYSGADRATLTPSAVYVATNGADTILAPNDLTLRAFAPSQAFDRLYVDPTSGDLMAAQDQGPNAGKSLNLTNGFAATGGGGVKPTGDTMTGTLAFSGDKFDASITGAAAPAFSIQSSQGGPSGFELGAFGDLQVTGPRRHIRFMPDGGIDLFQADGSRLTIATDYGSFGIYWVPISGAGVSMVCDAATGDVALSSNTLGNGIHIRNGQNTDDIRLHFVGDGSGDLVATAVAGPNTGKSVNLTAGKWV